jgi:YggT family protein
MIIYQLLSSLLNVFIILMVITALLSWFPQWRYTPIVQFITALTNPYINFFRRYFPLNLGMLDGSFILSILFLYFVQSALGRLAYTGRFSLIDIVIFFSNIVFTILGAIFFITALMATIRFVTLVILKRSGPFSAMCDVFLRRAVVIASAIIARRRIARYSTLLVFIAIGGFFINHIINILHSYVNFLISRLPL